ncbi:PAS domain-containing sensor histidine kinase [Bradyrhizobium sp. Tv2a-2]|uniref:PAS domain-containing sensor histidine kinase n=1 Tax=Bradyrhizobium sp. Tv2a-2 TaxID=113395 RepID=UPI0004027D4D|nr:PAS domain-containing sensor histidine kinase [Bradyrhizobium sp. Tv2a-2]
MVINREHSTEESRRLQQCFNDLSQIVALSTALGRGSLSQLVADLLEMLLGMLHLEFVYVRLKDPVNAAPIELGRTAKSLDGFIGPKEIGSVLNNALGSNPQTWPANEQIAFCDKSVSLVSLRLGPQGDMGILVAASTRADFPEETERLRLDVAANQAVIALQQGRPSSEARQPANAVDEPLAQPTIDTVSREGGGELEQLRRAVESLRLREIDIQSVVDAIPAPTSIMTAEGEVEAVNRPVLEYFGRSVDELRHWSTSDIVHPDDLQPTISAWRLAVETGEPYEVESRHRGSDGVYRWFHVRGFPLRGSDGHIVRWCVLQIDIEDRKRAEQALRTSERNLYLIISTIPGLVWSARPDGSADFFNQHYLDYVGFSSEQAQDWGWTAAVHPEDLDGLASAWQAFMATRQAGEKEARLRRFDGSYRWFLFRANPLRDDSGNVIKWFGINTDIEDRKRAEEELRDTQAKLAHMARVMMMGELTASIAHEVNQPLAGIVTNANTCLRMLAADPPNVAGARETVRRTLRDGNRASDIIGRLRALFNRKAPVSQPIDLNEATREVIALSLNKLHRDGVSLRTRLAEDLPRVTGDRVQLQQVILNLLNNAADAMSAIDDRPRELMVSTGRDEDSCVRLSVHDSGPGFDLEVAERLFDAFYTTKGDGMGIGLSVSRSIVENHHGRIWAALNDGPGATFSFSIPGSSEVTISIGGPEGKGTLAANNIARDVG